MTKPLDLNRFRRHGPTTVVCLPDDTDPARRCSEPVAIAGRTGDVLRQLRTGVDAAPDLAGSLPPPLEDPATLEAIERIEVAVGDAYRATPAQPLAPGGRHQLIPLRWARLDRADVATLGRVARALAAPGNQPVHDVVEDLGPPGLDQVLPADIARLHRLLDLDWDDDVADLAQRLPAGPTARTVVLDPAGAEAYRRLTERIIAVWHDGNPLARWLYQGGLAVPEAPGNPQSPHPVGGSRAASPVPGSREGAHAPWTPDRRRRRGSWAGRSWRRPGLLPVLEATPLTLDLPYRRRAR